MTIDQVFVRFQFRGITDRGHPVPCCYVAVAAVNHFTIEGYGDTRRAAFDDLIDNIAQVTGCAELAREGEDIT